MAEPGTRPAEIVGPSLINTCIVGVLPDEVPDGFLRHSIAPSFPKRACRMAIVSAASDGPG
jgi:hypothetical protein